MLRYVLPFLMLAGPAVANDEREAFVEANLLGIFYHELGHALIDILALPVFGQEEDAADVASVLLIDGFYEEDAAQALAYDTAFGFLAEADFAGDVTYWDVHGPDEQRFYNTVCLFYGGNPDAREDFAIDLGLPEERAETCPEEFQLALDSWGPAFDEITGRGNSILFEDGGHNLLTTDVMAAEVAALNDDFDLPVPLIVRVEACGEANAFYDLGTTEIIMCTEFEDHLRALYDQFE
ncbi:DUF4344 domain-containing metallopeptidase [Tateyamaria omphalii]|uniref:Metallopeptidase n=1 Tax=Tateyamaria omphalii TaxID=299262 RepID=A0A1P8MR26_9RHOB|nr:DUF4344 domain-containing metallopeptidase [Tateyamaria omphalii]APX10443.1 hypothetical protein BWR18_01045 [Tateyamaria omphalii]